MDIFRPKSVALVIGVTGMTGTSLVQALKSPTAPGSPWTVHGAARRPPPPRFPFSDLDTFVQVDSLDRDSTIRTLSPLATHVTHLFWVAVASRDTEEENIAANCAMLANALHALTSVTGYSLRHVTLQTGTQYYFGSFLNSDQDQKKLRVPFRENSPRLPYPVFYYALEDLLASYSHILTWTVHRSSFIFGASTISIYNLLLTLFIYALICRREGSQFMYPGNQYTWHSCCDATDSDLLADQQIWAATTTHDTKYQVFNCANGDIFTWRSFWEVTSNIFHLEYVECPQNELGPNWIDTMMTKGPVWDAIVQENGLQKTRLEEQISSFKAVYAVLNFKFHHVCDINKSQEYGFRRYMDTLKSMNKWVNTLKNLNVIPKD